MNTLNPKFIKAGSILTSQKVLKKLARDEDPVIRERVAANESTPSEDLVELSLDKCKEVRSSLSHNPNTPVQVIEDLARDLDPDVRLSVAQTVYTPKHILSYLLEDKNVHVSEAARDTLNKRKEETEKDNSRELLESSLRKELKRRETEINELTKILKENMADVDRILPDKLVSAFNDSVDTLKCKMTSLKETNEEAYQSAADAAELEMEKLRKAWQVLADAFNEALKVYEETGEKGEKEKASSLRE